MQKKFIVSTDSCVDHMKSYLTKNNVYSITLKRIVKGEEICEHFDSKKEFDAFYESIKKGALPSTAALNPFELKEYFEDILGKEPSGDIIHVSLSSGLSVTYDNAVKAAAEVNATRSDRKVYIVDSLVATLGMDNLVDELIKLRELNENTENAIKRVIQLRDHQQGWVVVNDLLHLKRGGRISGAKATIGTILNIKPIITINNRGKLAIENKVRGIKSAYSYLLDIVEKNGEMANPRFMENTFYLSRSVDGAVYEDFKSALIAKYPNLKIQESMLSPIIGTHVGGGAFIMLFEGAKRLEINDK